jgi:hypothetical protein
MPDKVRTLRPKPPAPDPLRVALRKALARRDEAERRVEVAKQSVERAESWLANKLALLKHYANTDELLAKQRVEIEKHFICTGLGDFLATDSALSDRKIGGNPAASQEEQRSV